MQPIPVRVDHPRLHPGVAVEVSGDVLGAAAVPRIRLMFSDGTVAHADILADGSSLTMAVEAHTTSGGTEIPPRTWRVTSIEPAEGITLIRLGGRLPQGP